MKKSPTEFTIYFFLTFLLVVLTLFIQFKPFDPLVWPERKETFLNPDETFIEDPEIYKNTLVPTGVQSSLVLTLKPYSEPVQTSTASTSASTIRVCDSFIKSSFNSVWDGSKCSISMMTYVISRGARFLDFEVFYFGDSQEEKPRLVIANGGNFRENHSSLKHYEVLSLSEVLKFIMSNAFSSTVCPTYSDPLFLHFRIQVAQKHSQFATQYLLSLWNSIIPSFRRCSSSDLANLSIGGLRNKCAILVDSKTCPWIAKSQDKELLSTVTAFTGTDSFPLLKFGLHAKNKAVPTTSTEDTTQIEENENAPTKVKIVGVAAIPSRDALNIVDSLFSSSALGAYKLSSLVENPSINFMAMPFYENNKALREYEELFNAQNSSMTTKTVAKAYVEELSGEI